MSCRLVVGLAAPLDITAQNRETWWGVMGHRSSGNPETDALADAIVEQNVQRILDNNQRQDVLLDGHTLTGEKDQRTVPVCGPATFVVLKPFAFADRAEPKDAYDLVYVLRRWPGGVGDIVERLGQHATRNPEVIEHALGRLSDNFATPDSLGPRRAAAFEGDPGEDLDAAAADARGYADDLRRLCRERGLHC